MRFWSFQGSSLPAEKINYKSVVAAIQYSNSSLLVNAGTYEVNLRFLNWDLRLIKQFVTPRCFAHGLWFGV
jgi:hypothetical protein